MTDCTPPQRGHIYHACGSWQTNADGCAVFNCTHHQCVVCGHILIAEAVKARGKR